MKIFNKLLILGFATLSLSAQTTMCFKQDHKSFATIQNTKLDGGVCKSEKSFNDMLKEGWESSDIKIDGNNYIYIFKKQTSVSSLDIEAIEAKILKKLETRKIEDAKAAIVKKKYNMSVSGKKMYLTNCVKCHGEKADVKSHNTSRPLIDLSLADFKLSIRGYDLREYDRGRAIIMKPYSDMLDTKDIKNVYVYIQSLKPKEENISEDKKEATK